MLEAISFEARGTDVLADLTRRTVRTGGAPSGTAEGLAGRATRTEVRLPALAALLLVADHKVALRAHRRRRAIREAGFVAATLARRTEGRFGAGAAAVAGELPTLLPAFAVPEARAARALTSATALGICVLGGRRCRPPTEGEGAGSGETDQAAQRLPPRPGPAEASYEPIKPFGIQCSVLLIMVVAGGVYPCHAVGMDLSVR